MVWFAALILLVLTVILLSGKGAFLIAGYNTASKRRKANYDAKKLCRVMGGGMGVITIALIVLACFGDYPPNWMLVALPTVILVIVAVLLVLCNTACKVKVENSAMIEEMPDEARRNRRILRASLLFTAVLFAIIGVILSTGQITVTVDDAYFEITGSYWADYQVDIGTLQSVRYTETLEVGKRSNGLGSFKLLEGHFRNDAFGDYILYAYANCDQYVVCETTAGTVVINAETPQETELLYQTLKGVVAGE